ncbi:MAG: hypothetical protein K2G45_12535 [Lachnospiraceae bacterium]|nr:hypothetical protein [Lachnospiraceae bacterium]
MKLKIDDEIVEDKNADEDTGNGNFDFSRTHTNKEQCIRNLEFLRDSYLAQMDGVEKRLFTLKSNLIACIGTYAIILTVAMFMAILTFRLISGFGLFALVACVLLAYALFKCNRDLTNAIVSYGVHFEKKSFRNIIDKYTIFTLDDERCHCQVEINRINKMIAELQNTDTRQADRKYWDYEYKEKHADMLISEIYDKYRFLIFIISVAFFLLVLIIVMLLKYGPDYSYTIKP